MIFEALYLSTKSSLDLVDVSPLEFDKELIYVGSFHSPNGKFDVDEGLIDHWVSQSVKMVEQGFKIKLPVDHTFDPEKNRGHVLQLSKRLDSKNRIGLFGRLSFIDEEAARLAKSTDVSIYSPPHYVMGNGYTANRPITHVALTDYPVVPGLDPFLTIAASLTEGTSMNLASLAEALGIKVPDGADDAAIGELIVAEFAKLKKTDPPKDPAPDPVQASLIRKLTLESREARIGTLVASQRLTPAEADLWRSSYCDAKTIQLSNTSDFDVAFALAQKREPFFTPGEKTPAQKVDLDKNPLIRDAKKRAGVA